MKNSNRWTPFIITMAFIAILFGVFLYRRESGSPIVSLSKIENTSEGIHPDATTVFQNGKININTASAENLTLLPGIGEKLAERIVAYRNENGPFLHIDDLTNVSGIGTYRLNAIIDYITLGG